MPFGSRPLVRFDLMVLLVSFEECSLLLQDFLSCLVIPSVRWSSCCGYTPVNGSNTSHFFHRSILAQAISCSRQSLLTGLFALVVFVCTCQVLSRLFLRHGSPCPKDGRRHQCWMAGCKSSGLPARSGSVPRSGDPVLQSSAGDCREGRRRGWRPQSPHLEARTVVMRSLGASVQERVDSCRKFIERAKDV